MTRLTDLQLILLSTASQRNDGSLLPPPDSVGERSPAIDKAITSLVRRGLATQLDTSDLTVPWPKDRNGLVGVRITAAGRNAIGVADNRAGQDEDAPAVTARLPVEKKDTKLSQALASSRKLSPCCSETVAPRSTT